MPNNSMDMRARAAIFLSRCAVTFGLRVIGFARANSSFDGCIFSNKPQNYPTQCDDYWLIEILDCVKM